MPKTRRKTETCRAPKHVMTDLFMQNLQTSSRLPSGQLFPIAPHDLFLGTYLTTPILHQWQANFNRGYTGDIE
ncbi:unnamed protein product [Prunus armeniaca]|uniref:Uncharacterized protein n=1 Tax=Prunus armeniaca TaxID=36596 RepID=A0A6J5VL77_PRUAR|nr:unnamed protein product [Prunus armeniaca]